MRDVSRRPDPSGEGAKPRRPALGKKSDSEGAVSVPQVRVALARANALLAERAELGRQDLARQ